MRNVKNRRLALLLSFVLVTSCSFGQRPSDCSAAPYSVVISQPDGNKLTIKGIGNEFNHHSETIDGYSIALNNKGYYVYLNQDTNSVNNSGQPVLTPFIAHDPSARHNDEKIYLTSVPQHLRSTHSSFAQASQSAFKTGGLSGFSPNAPLTGKNKVLMLLVEYPDLKATYTKQAFDSLMNTHGYHGTGCFHDYYLENSFGKLNITIDVEGWYMAPDKYKTYSTTDYNGARLLVSIALDSAHAHGVDFSKYDNDKNGYVDAVILVHAGPGAEEGAQTQYIWSHHWILSTSSSSATGPYVRYYNGVHISSYTIQPEIRLANGPRITGIGVFCHEYGHVLGLPDYYNTEPTPTSNGVGEWEVMGGGNWLNNEHSPASFSAYSKTLFSWLTPKNIAIGGYYTLKPAAKDTLVYKITTPDKYEYYLLENKQRIRYDSALDGTGLLIWHVNDSLMSALIGINRVDTNINAEALAVVQADGKFDLEKNVNRGDAGDPFPGTSKNTGFNDTTNPSAKLISGRKSGISVLNITQNADSTVTFGFGAPPVASFSVLSYPVCQYDSIRFTNTSQYANQYSWDFGDTTTDTVFAPKHIYRHPGTYKVKLKVANRSTKISNTDSSAVLINKRAKAGFTTFINGLNIIFHNHSTNNQYIIWKYGDGNSGYKNDSFVNYAYKDTGMYNVIVVAGNSSGCSDTFRKTVHIKSFAGIAGDNPIQNRFTAYPNPFSNSITIQFGIDQEQEVAVSLFSSLGQKISSLSSKKLSPGYYNLNYSLDNFNLRSGMYIVEVKIDGKPYYIREVKE